MQATRTTSYTSRTARPNAQTMGAREQTVRQAFSFVAAGRPQPVRRPSLLARLWAWLTA